MDTVLKITPEREKGISHVLDNYFYADITNIIVSSYLGCQMFYNNVKDIKCLNCHGDVILVDNEDKYEEFDDEYIAITIEYESCPTCYCPSCEIYLLLCNDCTELDEDNGCIGEASICKFLGHCGIYYERIKNNIKPRRIQRCNKSLMCHSSVNKENDGNYKIDTVIEKIPEDILKRNEDETYNCYFYIKYYTGDKNLPYHKKDKFCVTGPDGGLFHYWKCLKCKKIIPETDK
jgi:hypothetical protein